MELVIPHIDNVDIDSVISIQKNDCSIRTLSSSYNLSYDDSDLLLQKMCKKVPGKGPRVFYLLKFFDFCDKINGKKTLRVDLRRSGLNTVQSLILYNRKGTFVILVRGHMFTFKDGKVIGNYEDRTKLKRRIIALYQVIDDNTPPEEVLPFMSFVPSEYTLQTFSINESVEISMYSKGENKEI